MSVLSVSTREEQFAQRERNTALLRERAAEQIHRNSTSKFSYKFQVALLKVINIAIPFIMITASTIPFFIPSLYWLPFATAGGFFVIMIIQIVLEERVYRQKKREEAYTNLDGMLASYHPSSMYPLTVADLPKDERWLSDADLIEPNYENRREQSEEYQRLSPRSLHRFDGTHTSHEKEGSERPLYNLDAPLSLSTFSAAGTAGLRDAHRQEEMRRFVRKGGFRKNLWNIKRNICDYQRAVLLQGGFQKAKKAQEEWEAYLTEQECSEEDKKALDHLDDLRMQFGKNSGAYQDACNEFLAIDDADKEKRAELDRMRLWTFSKRFPLYKYEFDFEKKLTNLKEDALMQAPSMSKKIFGELTPEQIKKMEAEKNLYQDILTLQQSLLLLKSALLDEEEGAYNKWLDISPFFEGHGDFQKALEIIQTELDEYIPDYVNDYEFIYDPKVKTQITFFDLHEVEFRIFVDAHPMLRRKLLRLSVQMETTLQVLQKAVVTDPTVRLQKGWDVLNPYREALEAQYNKFEEQERVSAKEMRRYQHNLRKLQELKNHLQKIEDQLGAFRNQDALDFEDRKAIAKLETQLNKLLVKEILPLSQKSEVRKDEAVSRSTKEIMRKAFFPKKVKPEKPEFEDTFRGMVLRKQYAIDLQLAAVDHKLCIIQRIYALGLRTFIDIPLLCLTGIFFYINPTSLTAAVIIMSIDWTVSMAKLAIEFYIPTLDKKKKQLKMQRYFVTRKAERLPPPASFPEVQRLHDVAKRIGLEGTELTDAKLRTGGKIKEKGRPRRYRPLEKVVITSKFLEKTQVEMLEELEEGEELIAYLQQQYILVLKHLNKIDKYLRQLDEQKLDALQLREKQRQSYLEDSRQKKQDILDWIKKCSGVDVNSQTIADAQEAINSQSLADNFDQKFEDYYDPEENFFRHLANDNPDDFDLYLVYQGCKKDFAKGKSRKFPESLNIEFEFFGVEELKSAAEPITSWAKPNVLKTIERRKQKERIEQIPSIELPVMVDKWAERFLQEEKTKLRALLEEIGERLRPLKAQKAYEELVELFSEENCQARAASEAPPINDIKVIVLIGELLPEKKEELCDILPVRFHRHLITEFEIDDSQEAYEKLSDLFSVEKCKKRARKEIPCVDESEFEELIAQLKPYQRQQFYWKISPESFALSLEDENFRLSPIYAQIRRACLNT